MNQGHC